MRKKKRIRKLTAAGCVEGDREQYFLYYLREIYQPEENNIAFYSEHGAGGNPDKLVKIALRKCDRDKSFAWFDEDFEPHQPLGQDIRESLAKHWRISDDEKLDFLKCPLKDLQSLYNPSNRKPTLIISHPVCVESLILKILDKPLPYENYDHAMRDAQIKVLKDKLNGMIGSKKEIDFYRENFSKEKMEAKRKEIPALDLLIKMLTK